MFEVIWLPGCFKIKIDQTWSQLKHSEKGEMMSLVIIIAIVDISYYVQVAALRVSILSVSLQLQTSSSNICLIWAFQPQSGFVDLNLEASWQSDQLQHQKQSQMIKNNDTFQ